MHLKHLKWLRFGDVSRNTGCRDVWVGLMNGIPLTNSSRKPGDGRGPGITLSRVLEGDAGLSS